MSLRWSVDSDEYELFFATEILCRATLLSSSLWYASMLPCDLGIPCPRELADLSELLPADLPVKDLKVERIELPILLSLKARGNVGVPKTMNPQVISAIQAKMTGDNVYVTSGLLA